MAFCRERTVHGRLFSRQARALVPFVVALCLGGWARADAQPSLLVLSRIAAGSVELEVGGLGTAPCNVTVFASASRSDLAGKVLPARRRIGTAQSATEKIRFVASSLPAVFATGSRVSIFFRVQAQCPSTTTQTSRLVSARFRSGLRGVQQSAWLRRLRQRLKVSELVLQEAFPTLRFDSPLDLQNAGDGSGVIYVVEQGGVIWSITQSNGTFSKKMFLDISRKTERSGEQGLIGLAFHPRYQDNGQFFVHYTARESGTSMISRFTRSSVDPLVADGGSEFSILTQEQPFSNHNGGGLAFGPDGYLYIGFGDGGSGGDPLNNSQNRRTLLGKMLRIDVDGREGGKNYRIPSDNPFVGSTETAPEIFALGLRNPYRFSFDFPSNRLLAGDVGQGAREEIDRIEKGKNYGWRIMEGSRCFSPEDNCDQTGLELPLLEYGRDDGSSVTGGYVYRGRRIPSLIGKYVFGDFVSGRIWSLALSEIAAGKTELFDSDLLISSFGRDESGEIYVVSYQDGVIYTLSQ
jgi:glucose/arabinose dehydrogenase